MIAPPQHFPRAC